MLTPQSDHEIPELTQQVARAAFPKGNKVMKIRDALGPIFEDELFKELYPFKGQPAESPAKLAMVTLFQYMEGLTDREAAEAVRSRIDWKYALGLELTDAGFNYSVLSEYRDRLLAGQKGMLLLEELIKKCEKGGLLAGKRKQRTDSTHVLAKIRTMNLIELAGEAMRRALNELAKEYPEWLGPRLLPEWGKRYGRPVGTVGLSQSKQAELVQQIGEDGHYLLEKIDGSGALPEVKGLKSVMVLRQVWLQQFYHDGEKPVWRRSKEHGRPSARKMIASPDDLDARYAKKGETAWTGYKVHLTETWDEDSPHLITQVETTVAPVPDMSVTQKIQSDLIASGLRPDQHLCDGAYVDADNMANALEHGITLVGPVHQDSSWQAQTKTGYSLAHFTIDWERMTATCPQGKTSSRWKPRTNRHGDPDYRFEFNLAQCQPCSARSKCTKSKKYGRHLTVYPPKLHQLLTQARLEQESDSFKTLYNNRAGIEGTISQAVNKLGIRQSRYLGLLKTHLKHIATAAAINLHRIAAWLSGDRPEQTRTSHFEALVSAF